MPIEIERKFRVTGDAWRAAAHAVVPMAQGYLGGHAAADGGMPRASVRVRLAGRQAFLDIKSCGPGRGRQEFDCPIPVEHARALPELCGGGSAEKHRHLVRHRSHLWEVGEFLGGNAGLVVAEIELGTEDEAFERPAWIGVEVTDLPRYYNQALAACPRLQWSRDEREPRGVAAATP